MLATKSALAAAIFCVLLVGEAIAEVGSLPFETPTPVYTCLRTTSPIVVDGLLVEPDWSPSTAIRLTSWDGQPRNDPPTSAWMRWDDTNLYIAFHSTDPHVQAEPFAHDAPIYTGEVVEAFIDPLGQGSSCYEFEVNAAGSTFDALFPAGHDQIPGFDAKRWDCAGLAAATKVVGTLNFDGDIDTGWTAELAIPFAALDEAGNRRPQVGQTWRINLYRVERASEGAYYLAWSPTLTADPNFHVPARFGTVRFEGHRPGASRRPIALPPLPHPPPAPTSPPVSASVLIVAIALSLLIAVIVALKQRSMT